MTGQLGWGWGRAGREVRRLEIEVGNASRQMEL